MPAAAVAAAVLSPGCCPVAVSPGFAPAPAKHTVMEPQLTDAGALAAELEHLVHEERQLSAVRRRLHEQIDNGFPNAVILRREREVSDRRRALHRRIDALRTYLTPTAPRPAI
jgi:hypothetical protein